MRLLICVFIYLLCCCHFLSAEHSCSGPRHAERPNMAVSVNRSPGATRQKKGGNHPAKFSAGWLPAGIIRGPERFFFFYFSFYFSCTVSRLESSTPTLLLTQPLRDGCNSSLSMAPVIEPSEREKEGGRRRQVGKWERVKLNFNFRAVTVVRGGNSSATS